MTRGCKSQTTAPGDRHSRLEPFEAQSDKSTKGDSSNRNGCNNGDCRIPTGYDIVGGISLHTHRVRFNHDKEKALGDEPVHERRRDNERNGVAIG